MEAEIILECDDTKYAEAITKAVAPDNFKSISLSISTSNEGNKVVTYIKCKRKIPTLIATIDDLLSCVSTTEKSLQALMKTM